MLRDRGTSYKKYDLNKLKYLVTTHRVAYKIGFGIQYSLTWHSGIISLSLIATLGNDLKIWIEIVISELLNG